MTKRYKYCSLYYSKYGISFECTDNNTIDWVIALAKQSVSSCKIENHSWSVRMEGLKGTDIEVGQMLRAQLCNNEWEPFSVTRSQGSDNVSLPFTYHFKQLSEE